MSRHTKGGGLNRRPQHGIVLVVALILLAVMTLSAVASFRGVLTADVFSNNVRTHALALQSAEQALRYCEAQLALPVPEVPVQPLPATGSGEPQLWQDLSTWQGLPAMASPVPAALVQTVGSPVGAGPVPQCLIEEMLLPRVKGSTESAAFLVTARGFSPDYQHDALGTPTGAEVWVQSVIRQ